MVLVIVGFAALIIGAHTTVEPEAPTFSVSASGWMPSAPPLSGLTETWFCPGVPASGVDGVEGALVIANRFGERLVGTILLVNDRQQSQRLELEIDPWASASVDLDELLPGTMVGAVIEVEGGGALVEQHAFDPAGDSVAPCSNATSDTWYLADGFTVDGSLDQIVLTNPYEQTVVVNLEFATREGSRRPHSYRGLTMPAAQHPRRRSRCSGRRRPERADTGRHGRGFPRPIGRRPLAALPRRWAARCTGHLGVAGVPRPVVVRRR